MINYDELPDDWEPSQKILFTRLYTFVVTNQAGIRHPDAPLLSDPHWNSVAHNVAFAAAEFLENEAISIVDQETMEVIAESPGRLDS